MLELKKTVGTYNEEAGRQDATIKILVDGQEIGFFSIAYYENGALLERFDIQDEYENKGYRMKALKLLACEFDSVIIAPDNPEDQGFHLYIV